MENLQKSISIIEYFEIAFLKHKIWCGFSLIKFFAYCQNRMRNVIGISVTAHSLLWDDLLILELWKNSTVVLASVRLVGGYSVQLDQYHI